MNRKVYVAPMADIIALYPIEDVAATAWGWGAFATPTASMTATKMEIEDGGLFDFNQSNDSYTLNN